MNIIKKLFKEHSPYLLGLTFIEGIICLVVTISFVYTDSLLYTESNILANLQLDKLLQTMYSSTWWALILLLLAFIVIFNLVTIIYKKMEYSFISICIWFMLMILSINIGNPISDIISKLLLFIPIIIINIIAYRTEKTKLEEITTKSKTKKNKASKK